MESCQRHYCFWQRILRTPCGCCQKVLKKILHHSGKGSSGERQTESLLKHLHRELKIRIEIKEAINSVWSLWRFYSLLYNQNNTVFSPCYLCERGALLVQLKNHHWLMFESCFSTIFARDRHKYSQLLKKTVKLIKSSWSSDLGPFQLWQRE